MYKRIASFTVKENLYEVYNEGGKLFLYKDGARIGEMWWLSTEAGLGRFRAVAKVGYTTALFKAVDKRETAKRRRALRDMEEARRTTRPGWKGHVALRDKVKEHLNI